MNFIDACKEGNLEYLQTVELDNIDIHANREFAFRSVCENGHLEVAKWLYETYKEKGDPINIDAGNFYFAVELQQENAFFRSCRNGHLEVAKWLYEKYKENNMEPVIYLTDTEFYTCGGSKFKHVEISKWLITLYSTRYLERHNYLTFAKEELENRKNLSI